MVNWLNDAWLDIQSAHQDWQFLRATCAFPTVQSQALYTPTQANAANFGQWDMDTFRNYANPVVTLSIASPCEASLVGHGLLIGDSCPFFTTGALPTGVTAGATYYVVSTPTPDTFTFSATVGGAPVNSSGTQSGTQTMTSSNITMFAGLRSEIFFGDSISYESWRDNYFYGNLRFTDTRPIEIAQSPAKALCLGPIPASGWTVLGDYFKAPSYLVNDTDTPPIDVQYQMGIVYKALISYGMYEEDQSVIGRGEKMYAGFKNRMELNYLPSIRFSGAIA
jgi:hypothetical protein